LQVIGASLARREDEMALQKRMRRPEFRQNLIVIHVFDVPLFMACLIVGRRPRFNTKKICPLGA
jgi:hypothetical protein